MYLRADYSSCTCIEHLLFQTNLSQSYRDSISVTAQCIETQHMPNERSGKDLQIRRQATFTSGPYFMA